MAKNHRKKIIGYLSCFLAFFIFVITKPAFAGLDEISSEVSQELIERYDTIIEIQDDSSLIITEKIFYNFDKNERHGIYRFIPIKYYDRHRLTYSYKIKLISVTDENGNPLPYKTKYQYEGNFFIRIGDPKILVTGKKEYQIKYKLERGLRFFPNYDELYWNVIGTEWDVPINSGTARIILPKEIPKEQLMLQCFTGYFGQKEENCSIQVVDSKTIDFTLLNSLLSRQGMTIDLAWPKGMVQKQKFYKELFWYVRDNWGALLALFSFSIALRLWLKKGKDPKRKGPIIAQYEPPKNFSPLEVGLIFAQKIRKRDITATIVDLAVRGFLKIKKSKKTFLLIKQKDSSLGLKNFEASLLNLLFPETQKRVFLNNLKYNDQFWEGLNELKEKIYNEMTDKSYFVEDPQKVRIINQALGWFSVIFAFFYFIFVDQGHILINSLSLFFSGIAWLVFAIFMPKRTEKGLQIFEYILGFKEFLTVTEKERLKLLQAPEMNPELFEKFLPYAIVLKVEKKWAKKFQKIYKEASTYQSSFFVDQLSTSSLISSLNSFSSGFRSVAGSGFSGGGGGGSAGGGGGGGGGGSW